ncbi:MAG: DUF1348 family protein [Pseudomonadales bacterium]
MSQDVPSVPPFSESSARHATRLAEAAWNTRDPDLVVLGYAPDALWRDRGQTLSGRDAIRAYLERKWRHELHQRTAMALSSHTVNRISVRVQSEWQHSRTGQWYRTSGTEHWEYDDSGLIQKRDANPDDEPIGAGDRSIGVPRA